MQIIFSWFEKKKKWYYCGYLLFALDGVDPWILSSGNINMLRVAVI